MWLIRIYISQQYHHILQSLARPCLERRRRLLFSTCWLPAESCMVLQKHFNLQGLLSIAVHLWASFEFKIYQTHRLTSFLPADGGRRARLFGRFFGWICLVPSTRRCEHVYKDVEQIGLAIFPRRRSTQSHLPRFFPPRIFLEKSYLHATSIPTKTVPQNP